MPKISSKTIDAVTEMTDIVSLVENYTRLEQIGGAAVPSITKKLLLLMLFQIKKCIIVSAATRAAEQLTF